MSLRIEPADTLDMPYKDPEKKRQYAREWMQKRRDAYFHDKICVACGSTGPLELDHVNPNEKVDHRIWSWSQARRDVELAKCQPLCIECHRAKTAVDVSKPVPHGTDTGYTARKCRCSRCTAAHNLAKNAYRASRRQRGLSYT